MNSSTLKSSSYLYLLLVPVLSAALGFGVGHVSYTLYLPVWIVNVALMILASWSLGLKKIRSGKEKETLLAWSAFFLFAPWILITMFAGLGPPPETAADWTATAKEQQIRYFMLVIAGVLLAFGFAGIRESLKAKGENFYSLLGLTAVLIAIPLFILNMLFWGFYLSEFLRIQSASQADTYPDWHLPVRELFGLISVVEVALTYLATCLYAVALKKTGWFSPSSSLLYGAFSLAGFAIMVLSALFPESLKTVGFVVSIPAFPLLLPYFVGVNLLRKVGDQTES